MEISEKGLDLIRHFEGLRLQAYQCPAGVWTVGYGHALGVVAGDEITVDEANDLLRQDIIVAVHAVRKYVTAPLSQGQFDAFTSFVFNLGEGNFRDSTLLKKFNAGDVEGTANEFLRWVKAGGKTTSGLLLRREAERSLFLEMKN